MKPEWVAATPERVWVDEKLGISTWRYVGDRPPLRRMVLVQIDKSDTEAACVAVGYLKLAAGDPECPYFVVPGARPHFKITHWADCLGDDFTAPLWGMRNEPRGNSSNHKEPK